MVEPILKDLPMGPVCNHLQKSADLCHAHSFCRPWVPAIPKSDQSKINVCCCLASLMCSVLFSTGESTQ